MLSLDEKSNKFSIILHEAAADLDCLFSEESGEGNDMVTDTLYCEDVAGWLIPIDRKDEFVKSNRKDDKWREFFVFAEWEKCGNTIKINFVKH